MVYIHSDLKVQPNVAQVVHCQDAAFGEFTLKADVHLIRTGSAEVGMVRVAESQSVAHKVWILPCAANGGGGRNILGLQIGHRLGRALCVNGAGAERRKANLRRQIVAVDGRDRILRATGAGKGKRKRTRACAGLTVEIWSLVEQAGGQLVAAIVRDVVKDIVL